MQAHQQVRIPPPQRRVKFQLASQAIRAHHSAQTALVSNPKVCLLTNIGLGHAKPRQLTNAR
jgi:hypothetical protein